MGGGQNSTAKSSQLTRKPLDCLTCARGWSDQYKSSPVILLQFTALIQNIEWSLSDPMLPCDNTACVITLVLVHWLCLRKITLCIPCESFNNPEPQPLPCEQSLPLGGRVGAHPPSKGKRLCSQGTPTPCQGGCSLSAVQTKKTIFV